MSSQSTPSVKLLATLAVSGMLAGLLIVSAFELTLPSIEANRAARIEAAIFEVLPEAESFTTLYLHDGALHAEAPAGTDPKKLEKIFAGRAEDGSLAGYAIPSAQPGFMDKVGLIFGYDTANGEVLGMKVLESKETPGLGSKIETEASFVDAFRGVVGPVNGVRPGKGVQANDVEVISGATISSRTVIKAINSGIETWAPRIESWETREKGQGS